MSNNCPCLTSLVDVNFATEGLVDAAVAERLIRHCGAQPGNPRIAGGKTRLDPNIPRYVNSARQLPWLILRDLDHDAACGPELRQQLSSEELPLLCLRIAVREIEAWLMHDREALSRFLKVRVARIPEHAETLDDPKQALINAARSSTSSSIREAMTPRDGAGASEGPEFAAYMVDFVRNHWDIRRAVGQDQNTSLARAVRCLTRLVAEARQQFEST